MGAADRLRSFGRKERGLRMTMLKAESAGLKPAATCKTLETRNVGMCAA